MITGGVGIPSALRAGSSAVSPLPGSYVIEVAG